MKTLLFAVTISLSLAVSAGTWYVDASRPNDEGDGQDPATAKRTIQAAVNAAETSGEAELTVLVAPGTYAEGEHTDSNGAKNRIVITKKLTLRSTGSRDDTFVVGVKDGSTYGLGSASVRGICVDGSGAVGTVIQGFAFKDCSAGKENGATKPSGQGGAVCFNQDSGAVYVKDCAAIDCAAYYGGGFRGVIALRSLVKQCRNNDNSSHGAALYKCKAYCCVFDSCGPTVSYNEYILQGDGPYVNCTAVGNSGCLLRTSADQKTYNLLSMLATRQEFDGTNAGGDYVIVTTGNGTSKFEHSWTVANDSQDIYQLLVAPLSGDYRPVKGGKAEGFGDPQYCALEWIPTEERNLDYFRNEFAIGGSAGSIDCGAVQGAVAVAGGRIVVPRTVPTTSSATVTLNFYHQSDTWPTQLWIADGESDTFAVSLGSDVPIRFPKAEGGFWLTVPQSGEVTPTWIAATAQMDVGPSAAYQTIQAAVDAASDAADAYTVISVTPGEYGPVTIGAKNVRIRSTGGKAVTTIKGVKDDTVAENRGCGPNAKRCVTVEAGDRLVSVEGFTLRGGATTIGSGDSQDDSAAGAWSAKKKSGVAKETCQLSDCDIVDCSGFNAAAVWGGWLQRCAISNCVNANVSGADSVVRGAYLSSCLLSENDHKNNQVMANGTLAMNCTVVARYGGEPKNPVSATSWQEGVVVCGGRQTKAAPTVGSVLYDYLGECAITSGFVSDNALMANPEQGRYRLLAGSPAIGCWNIAEKAASGNPDPWKFVVDDIEGHPAEIVNGKVTAGAFHARYEAKDVYVDAARENDNGDGLTLQTAKRTLAAAMSVACCGDTVHAAAGTYGERTMSQLVPVCAGETFAVAARIRIPARAKVIGAGRGLSVIRGGFVEDGNGEKIRCVLMSSGAVLRGFTVADGLCATTGSSSVDDDMCAAGVLADRSAVVEDCEITGNHSYAYGGVRGGVFRRCVFSDNWAQGGTASAGSLLIAENCLFSGNRGQNILADYERIDNCTFLYDNMQLNGTSRISRFGTFAEGAVIRNSALVLAPTTESTPMPHLYNCLLPKISGATWRWDVTDGVNATDCLLSETTVDSSWTGVPDADYVGMDRGLNAAAPVGDDLAGVQRIQNSVVDIGCYEYDWMPTYSAAFSRRGWAEVTTTSGAVTNSIGGVAVGDGGALAAKMVSDPGGSVVIVAQVSGSGALSVKVNGVGVGSLSSTVSRLPIGEVGVNDVIEMTLAGAGDAIGVRLGSDMGLVIIVE